MKKLFRITAHDITLGLLKGQIRYLSDHFDITLVANDTGRLAEIAEREGVKHLHIPMKREISIGADLKSLRKLYTLFRREKPDIVHANTPKGALLAMMAAKLARVPHRVYNANGLRFETTTGRLRKILILMEKITCLCATKVVPQSNGVAEVLRRERITKKPLKVILNGSGNGVDTAHFNPEAPDVIAAAAPLREKADGKFTYLFMGRLVKDKGVAELVGAFKRLNERHPETRLVLLGNFEQDLDPLPAEIVEEIKRNENILEAGYTSDVRPYLKSSDVFVLPSYREGFPNVVLEALSMGVPVVVSDVNGATDAVTTGLNGIVVPKGDEDALYAAMEELLTDESERKAMAKAARPSVIERFSRPDVWAATLEMYRSL
ncbi:MAG: glycosyltransferase family 4 protein [Muribaculaceae bacterium]|nr:glycosyltransferase family 4 protein [Muribaculaceae bacterium]